MNKLVPTMYQKSIFDINYKLLKKKNIKLILFDLDNTCIPYLEKKPNKKLGDLFKELKKMGFEIKIFSNASENRLKPFKDLLEIDCYHKSYKPLKYKLSRLVKNSNYKKSEIIIIGDQLFTDILVGNRAGINTLLVTPLSNNDLFITKVWRSLEQLIFKRLEKKGILSEGKYYE